MIEQLTYLDILRLAGDKLKSLKKRNVDVVDILKPEDIEYAVQLSKVVSKLSPLIGNMIEYSIVSMLNEIQWGVLGKWERQDPGFPDAIFRSEYLEIDPGIEIKAWFPLATEITARFKESVKLFNNNHIDVAIVAWLPDHIIWGKPQIIDTLVVSAKSVAEARDKHYHKPPEYIVFEPEDTAHRTSNLQQTNTNGYKLQEDKCNAVEARQLVQSWGESALNYSPEVEYQKKLQELQSRFNYRLDTNYAKVDRIEHPEIEAFKKNVLSKQLFGCSIKKWFSILSSRDDSVIKAALNRLI